MIHRRNFINQLVKSNLRTYDNIQKIAAGKGSDYTTGCLLDYLCFKNYYKLVAIDLRKQHELDADPKTIQQINFTGNIYQSRNTTMFFIIEEEKETTLDLS